MLQLCCLARLTIQRSAMQCKSSHHEIHPTLSKAGTPAHDNRLAAQHRKKQPAAWCALTAAASATYVTAASPRTKAVDGDGLVKLLHCARIGGHLRLEPAPHAGPQQLVLPEDAAQSSCQVPVVDPAERQRGAGSCGRSTWVLLDPDHAEACPRTAYLGWACGQQLDRSAERGCIAAPCS